MGDFIRTIGVPSKSIDITPDTAWTWGDFKNFGKSAGLGYVKENLFAMSIAHATSERQDIKSVEGYNVYYDPQLAEHIEDMGYFIHSKSPEETYWLLQRKKSDDEYATSSPGYIVGRILGGLTDPTALFMFAKAGRFFFTGSRLARSSKVGMALGGEELLKRKIDRTRTLSESISISFKSFFGVNSYILNLT